jgi:adenylyl-sulfate reductase (glutathione)
LDHSERTDQSPGTRANTSAVQIDTSFEGLGAGIISLVKGKPVANLVTKAIWHFLHTICVPICAPVNSLHAKYVSTGCEPCTRPGLPWQHEKEGRCWREEGKAKERGLHKGNIESEDALSNEHINGVSPFTNGGDRVAYVFNSQNLISLSRPGIENFARLENRTEPWFVVFDAPWRRFFQVKVCFINNPHLIASH